MEGNNLTDAAADAPSRPEEIAGNTAEKETGPPASTSEMSVPQDEASRLRELNANVRDQDDLEREVGRQVCPHL